MICDGTLDELNSFWFGEDAPLPDEEGEEAEPVSTPES